MEAEFAAFVEFDESTAKIEIPAQIVELLALHPNQVVRITLERAS
jgi:hypothetical protein